MTCTLDDLERHFSISQDVHNKNEDDTKTNNIRTKKRRSKDLKKWARFTILPDNALLYEGEYKKHSFSVLVPNKINTLVRQLALLHTITHSYAHEFYVKSVIPYIDEIVLRLLEYGNVVIRYISKSTKSKPIIYSEFPIDDFLYTIKSIFGR